MYAWLWPITLIALCSLTGCAPARPVVVAVPALVICPDPPTPVLPQVDGNLPLENSDSLSVLLERDDILRGHIKALRRTADCYKNQTRQGNEATHDNN